MGCLKDLLVYMVLTPGLAALMVIAYISGRPALVLGAVVLCILALGLYLLATGDD